MKSMRTMYWAPPVALVVGLFILAGSTKVPAQDGRNANELYIFEAGTPARAEEVNHNFRVLQNQINTRLGSLPPLEDASVYFPPNSGAPTLRPLPPDISRYELRGNQNELVHDQVTGLTWIRCSMGQGADESGCTGEASGYTFASAQELVGIVNGPGFAGFNDWRLPNSADLKTIIFCSNAGTIGGSATQCSAASTVFSEFETPTIFAPVFPGTFNGRYWSSSPFGGLTGFVDFGNGSASSELRDRRYRVRLVRGGQ